MSENEEKPAGDARTQPPQADALEMRAMLERTLLYFDKIRKCAHHEECDGAACDENACQCEREWDDDEDRLEAQHVIGICTCGVHGARDLALDVRFLLARGLQS